MFRPVKVRVCIRGDEAAGVRQRNRQDLTAALPPPSEPCDAGRDGQRRAGGGGGGNDSKYHKIFTETFVWGISQLLERMLCASCIVATLVMEQPLATVVGG